MDMDEGEGAASSFASVDLSSFELPVVWADDKELGAHQALLDGLDKASRGQTVWKKIQASAALPA